MSPGHCAHSLPTRRLKWSWGAFPRLNGVALGNDVFGQSCQTVLVPQVGRASSGPATTSTKESPTTRTGRASPVGRLMENGDVERAVLAALRVFFLYDDPDKDADQEGGRGSRALPAQRPDTQWSLVLQRGLQLPACQRVVIAVPAGAKQVSSLSRPLFFVLVW